MTEEEYQILEELYMTGWPVKKRRTNSLMRKCEVLYELAKETEGGAIVELGTWHGCGAISLAFGTRASNGLPVYTIDDYSGRRGWAGEPYYPQDRARFLNCVAYAGVDVTLVQKDVAEAGRGWDCLIALLFWDLGVKDRLQSDFQMWARYIVSGGMFAIREGADKMCNRVLGSKEVMEDATTSGQWALGPQFPDGHVYTITKR